MKGRGREGVKKGRREESGKRGEERGCEEGRGREEEKGKLLRAAEGECIEGKEEGGIIMRLDNNNQRGIG